MRGAARRARPGSDPTRASALRQLDRPRLPVQPLRAGAVRRPRHPGGDDHDRARPAARRARRHGRAAAAGRGSARSAARPRTRSTRSSRASRSRPGRASYVFLGTPDRPRLGDRARADRGLLPFLAAAVDLFARCRRRRIRVAPGAPQPTAAGSRSGLWCGARLRPSSPLLGVWPDGRRAAAVARRRPLAGRRARSARRARRSSAGSSRATGCSRGGRSRAEEELAGHAAALLALGVVGLLVVATNPFALVFVLPSLHIWLWLPQVRRGAALGARRSCSCAGFAGAGAPALVVREPLRARLGRAVVHRLALSRSATRPLPGFVIALGWARRRGQLVALVGGRYAPYPTRGRAAAARADPRDRPADRARAAPPPRIRNRAAARCTAEMRRARTTPGRAADRGRAC